MKNTTSTKTIWIFLVLLLAALVFWRWSLHYRASQVMNHDTMMMGTEPATNEQLDQELEASMNSNSEIELRGVDEEF